MKPRSTTNTRFGRAPLMLTRRAFGIFLAGSVAPLLALPCLQRDAHAAERVTLAVVVAKSSSIQNLSMTELRRIFTNEADRDSSGERYVPFNHPPHTTDREGFDQLVLGMSADEVSQFWIERRIRALPGPPRTIDSLSLLLRLVARLPGAIGYARPNQLTGDVRVVRISGKMPDEAGYALTFDE